MHEEEERVIKSISLGEKVHILHVSLPMLVQGYTHGRYKEPQHTCALLKVSYGVKLLSAAGSFDT